MGFLEMQSSQGTFFRKREIVLDEDTVNIGAFKAQAMLVAGMILGAHLGPEAIPQRWLTDLKAYSQIVQCMHQIDEQSG